MIGTEAMSKLLGFPVSELDAEPSSSGPKLQAQRWRPSKVRRRKAIGEQLGFDLEELDAPAMLRWVPPHERERRRATRIKRAKVEAPSPVPPAPPRPAAIVVPGLRQMAQAITDMAQAVAELAARPPAPIQVDVMNVTPRREKRIERDKKGDIKRVIEVDVEEPGPAV